MCANGDVEGLPPSRGDGMRIAAFAGARNLLCEGLALGTLEAYRGDVLLPTQPAWLYRTDSDVHPSSRLLWTYDDLLWFGRALWSVARTSSNAIADAVRVPIETWHVNADGKVVVTIDGQDVEPDPSEILYIPGWDEGLLATGRDVIPTGRDINRAVRQRVRTPVPTTVIDDQETGRTPDEATALVEQYVDTRRNDSNGAVVYSPPGVKLEEFGKTDPGLYENARNATTLDAARLTGVPASLLEGSGVAASLNYKSSLEDRSVLNDLYRRRARALEARLSMDDVTPRGTRIALNLTAITGPNQPLPTPTED